MLLSTLLSLCFVVMFISLVWLHLMIYDLVRVSTFNYVATCFIMICSISGAITLDMNGVGMTSKETKNKTYRTSGLACNVFIVKEKRSWAEIHGDFTNFVYAVTLSDGSSFLLGEKEWNNINEGDHIPDGMCNEYTKINNIIN